MPPVSVAAALALLFALFVTAPVARVWAAAQPRCRRATRVGGDGGGAGGGAGAAWLGKHTPARERQSFLELQRQLRPAAEREAVGENDLVVLAPAFATAELKSAFQIGFLLFLPFLVIELLVSTVLMSLGMTSLAPELVSLPFKLLLFVLADGVASALPRAGAGLHMTATAHALREALLLVLVLAAPPLVAVFGVGLASGVLQAVTQVRERSLSTVPRIVAALVALALAGPWIAMRLEAFLRAVLEAVPALGRS